MKRAKTARPARNPAPKYEFAMSGSDDMLFWTKGSSQQYLSEPTEYIRRIGIMKSVGSITKPPKVAKNVLGKYGILAMAFARKTPDFYHYIKPTFFTDITFLVSGKIAISRDSAKYAVSAGQMLVIPEGKTCHMRILAPNTTLFWLDASPKSQISKMAGKEISARNCKGFAEIAAVLRLYQKEIYGGGDLQILEGCAAAFYGLLMRELSGGRGAGASAKIAEAIERARRNPAAFRSASALAKSLRITPYELDKTSLAQFGETFSKRMLSMRMNAAMDLLKNAKMPCAEVAQKVGYSSPFSFSCAFKKYFGARPSEFLK